MVAVLVRHQRSGRTGSLDDSRNREYVQVFRVLVTSSLDGPEVAGSAVGIPRIWAPYVPPSGRFDLGSWCRRVESNPTESDYVWEVQCHYSSRLEKGDRRPDQQHENPTQRPIEISLGVARTSVPAYYDVRGYAIVNSAGEPFDPPLMRDEKRMTINITKNMIAHNEGYYMNFIDTINSDKWMGFLPGQVKCVDVSASLLWEGSFAFWKVNFKFEAKQASIPKNVKWGNKKNVMFRKVEQSWTDFILDRGWREEYEDSDGNLRLRPIPNPDGIGNVSAPALLDGKGHAILKPMNKRTSDDITTSDQNEFDEVDPESPANDGPYTGGSVGSGGATDDGTSGRTDQDPVFIAFCRFPLRKFAALGIF